MKAIKITLAILSFGFFSIFAYANLRFLSETDRLKEIHIASFDLDGPATAEALASLEHKVSLSKGVTACSVNQGARLVSVTFHPDMTDETKLTSIISDDGNWKVAQRQFTGSASGGCPVHAVGSSFDTFISALDLRN